MAVALVAYVYLLSILGFVISTIALSLVLSLPGALPMRMRIFVCVAGTVATVGLYLLFVNVFNVPLPSPVWSD